MKRRITRCVGSFKLCHYCPELHKQPLTKAREVDRRSGRLETREREEKETNMRDDEVITLVVVLVISAVTLTVYVALIVLGVNIAKRKNRSPHWFWFAVHPIGLIITLIVMACLPALRRCPNCAQTSNAQARLCGFCGYDFATQGYFIPHHPSAYMPPRY